MADQPDTTATDNTAAADAAKAATKAPAPTPAKTAATPVEADAPAPITDAVDDMVDLWIFDQIHNSPVSRDTEAYNYLREALEVLKQRIRGQ
jgi:hypothetical protein